MYKFRIKVVYIRFIDNLINIDDIINKKENDKLIVYHNIGFIENRLKV